MSVHIRRRGFNSLKLDTTLYVVGSRSSGKTELLKYFLYIKHKQIRIPILISGTESTNLSYNGKIPDVLIFNDYSSRCIGTLLKDQQLIIKRRKEHYYSKNIKYHSIIFMDDIIGTNKIWKKCKFFKQLIFAGRHFKITIVISVQRPLALPSEYRGNMDYVIICNASSKKTKKEIYEKYWNEKFGDFNCFKNIIDNCTEGYKVLLIDNNAMKDGEAKLEDCIFWMKSPNPSYLPKFRAGIKSIWAYNKKYYDKDWMVRQFDASDYDDDEPKKINIKLIDKKRHTTTKRRMKIYDEH